MQQDGHHHIGLEHIGAHGITALIGPAGTGVRILGTTQATYGGTTGTGETRGTIHGTGDVQATTAGATAGTTTRGITITIIITMATGAVRGTTMASDTEGTVTTTATEPRPRAAEETEWA